MSNLLECVERPIKKDKEECTPCERTSLVRPRYFCGQLLTEADLEAEQRYQREKSKLHNRYLHGWGVVCGLDVVCHPKCSSKGNVLVKEGYAIDCCGNDIFVTKEETLNIIEMIKNTAPPPDDCLKPSKKDPCAGLPKRYCLILKYAEEECRPVTALKRDEQGCAVKRCEPSRIKETHRFELKECGECGNAPESFEKMTAGLHKSALNFKHDGSLGKELEECGAFLKAFGEIFGKASAIEFSAKNHDVLVKYFCDLKEKLYSVGRFVQCDFVTKLDNIEFPKADIQEYAAAAEKAFAELRKMAQQVMRDCLCLKLSYPCPECTEKDQVVLACITVEGNNVTRICNQAKRQVMTFPKLFYWFPVNEVMWDIFKWRCCDENLGVSPLPKDQVKMSFFAADAKSGVADIQFDALWSLLMSGAGKYFREIIQPSADIGQEKVDDMPVSKAADGDVAGLGEKIENLNGRLKRLVVKASIGDIVTDAKVANSAVIKDLTWRVLNEAPVEEVVKDLGPETIAALKRENIETMADLVAAKSETPALESAAGVVATLVKKAVDVLNREFEVSKATNVTEFVEKVDEKKLLKNLPGEMKITTVTLKKILKRGSEPK